MIVIGLILYIVGMIIGINVNYSEHPEQIEYVGWMIGFCQPLIFAGIGFILYDVAMKGDDKLSQLRKHPKNKSPKMDGEKIVVECPECSKDIEIPTSAKVGDIAKCPHCSTEFKLT